jgi:hypothetical protein
LIEYHSLKHSQSNSLAKFQPKPLWINSKATDGAPPGETPVRIIGKCYISIKSTVTWKRTFPGHVTRLPLSSTFINEDKSIPKIARLTATTFRKEKLGVLADYLLPKYCG